jgi:hypothetical protein
MGECSSWNILKWGNGSHSAAGKHKILPVTKNNGNGNAAHSKILKQLLLNWFINTYHFRS